MNILLTNDDSMSAEGIRSLAKALAEVADVYVFAPLVQQSACGHGISLRRDIAVAPASDVEGAKGAWTVDGTPADCVKLGLFLLKEQGIGIDLVFSGTNHGGNLGIDVLYSGTVSGAIEGVLCGIPGVAMSINSFYPKHFASACRMAVQAAKLAEGKLDNKTVLNINVPDLPWEEIKGIRIAALGQGTYQEWFHLVEEEDAPVSYRYSAAPMTVEEQEGVDIMALRNGYITITPLHYDLTNHGLMREVEEWGFTL
ncbi:MAG: 5'/3'-nucleotidase SurE [Clostridiales bacterium]|nr:5'/3'-nucleotidase SurE [Clostridiales bacterium]